MQRTLTIVGIIVLFALGAAVIAGGFSYTITTYTLPSDPNVSAIFVGSLAGIVVLTIVVGGALSFAFKQLGGILQSAKPSAPGGPKPDANAAAPHVPAYSYKAIPEQTETRQFAIWLVVVLVLFVAFSAWSQWEQWMAQARLMNQTQWLIAAGSAVGIIVGTVVVGAGLAFWFVRTNEGQNKAAKK
ncbi:MAG: hypothetical protein FJ030_12315 [Chloroflexi bacterium]|nr:hypothetical protein [Chloroflexota bacterium]